MVKKTDPKAKPAVKRQVDAKPKPKSKAKTKKPLPVISEECIFWCNDGHTFKSLKELADGLMVMSNETFFYHANADKNDFSKWVMDVIEDAELASDLMNADTRDKAVACVVARLEFYK